MPMVICACGKRYRVSDEHIGRKVRCQSCGAIIPVVGEGATASRPAAAAPPTVERWHVSSHDGKRYGPITRAELDQWVADGLISPKCQLIREGQSQWQAASAIFPQLAAGPASDDPAVRAMSEWLASPMEFGQPPASCRVIAAYDMEWPFHDEPQHVSLVEYTMPDGTKGIGVAGPIEWSFVDIPFERFTHEELVQLYAGWYIQFCAVKADDYAPTFSPADERRMIQKVTSELGVAAVTVGEKFMMGGVTYYELSAQRGGRAVKIAGTVDFYSVYDASDKLALLPVLFAYLGFTFYSEEE